jgi:hypothetical protein
VKRLQISRGLWVVLAVGALALVETALALTGPMRAAPASDWDAAAATVRAGFKDGDLIVFAPAWADQVGRAHLGDKISVEMAGHADAERYRRVWEVSIRGAHAPEIDEGKLVKTSQHGKVTVALYERSAVEIAYDFTSHAADARVTQVPGGPNGEGACLKDQGGFRCAGVRVEPRTLEIDYQPRRGILAPVDGRANTRIEFENVHLGRTLVGYTGLHDYYSRKNAAGAVDFRVLIDGQLKFTASHGNTDGWKRFGLQTTPGRHTVRFEVSAANPAWRTFGFHAEARR